jgi:hypothetical protein
MHVQHEQIQNIVMYLVQCIVSLLCSSSKKINKKIVGSHYFTLFQRSSLAGAWHKKTACLQIDVFSSFSRSKKKRFRFYPPTTHHHQATQRRSHGSLAGGFLA